LKLRITDQIKSEENSQTLTQEIAALAAKLYPHSRQKREQSRRVLTDYYAQAEHTDVLVIHSPGGWGNMPWDGVQDWEKSIVTGVTNTLGKLGYNSSMVQYFRSGGGIWRHLRDLPKEMRFAISGGNYRADVMEEELGFILKKLPRLKIVLVGASQGASFHNAVMMRLGNRERVYSLELGTFFPHMKRRRLTEHTLAIDNNGLMPDPMCQRNLRAGFKAYFSAFYRWFKYRLQGKNVKFTNCINTPGHEYKWEYAAVHLPITEFLTAKLGVKQSS